MGRICLAVIYSLNLAHSKIFIYKYFQNTWIFLKIVYNGIGILKKGDDFLEELINQIVELDNHAKEKIRSIKDKEDNIETYISETLEKEKKKLDSRYVFMKKNAEERFNNKFAQEKERLYKSKT